MIGLNTVKVTTLVDLLRSRALSEPEQTAYTFLIDGETQTASLTYRELDQQAQKIAVYLRSFCLAGERALLLYPPGLDYISAFFGCLYAGVIAVPAYPPRPNRSLIRLQAIVKDAHAKVALTTKTVFTRLERSIVQAPELRTLSWLATEDIDSRLSHQWREPDLKGDTLAFLQYTSGSTAAPKGVMISHNNLIHNLKGICQCFEPTPSSKGVIWLPPYHDMGLIGGILQPLYVGAPVILMSPLMFLQSPVRWLRVISQYRATISGGPNFAYDLCVRKITPQQLAGLDLSSWEIAFNGAEPVNYSTLERFSERFAPYGFRREAFYPCYGMAETTLLVSGGDKTAPPTFKRLQEEALQHNQVSAQADIDKAYTVVGCGKSLADQQIVIAHPEKLTRCAAESVGEIWVSGPSVAKGYWNQPDLTEASFNAYLADSGAGPFFRTGDLGFIENGELFVTGRLKDVIIINGQNYYPQDIENTVEQNHPQIRPNCSAGFSIVVAGEEKLVIVAEINRGYHRRQADPKPEPANLQSLVQSIGRTVSKHHDLQIYKALLLKPGGIPKTSSGKIQRHACRAGFLEGTLEVLKE